MMRWGKLGLQGTYFKGVYTPIKKNAQYIFFSIVLTCVILTIYPLNFSPTNYNVFSQFPIMLWLFLGIISVGCILCIKFENNRNTRLLIAFSIFFILHIMLPLSNFPLGWKCTEEQAYFANAYSLGLNSRDIAWFGSQIVQILTSEALNLNLIVTNVILSSSLNFGLFLMFFVLGENIVGERYGYLVPIIFALSQTYEYNYFATQSLGLLIGLIIIWFISTKFYRHSIMENGEKCLFIVLILALSISHSLTALLLATFLGFYVILAFKFTRHRCLWLCGIAFLVLVSYNVYNFNSLIIVGQHLTSLLDAQRVDYAVNPSAYLGIPYKHNISYAILYFSRYIFLAIIGFVSIIGLLKMYRKNKHAFFVFLLFCGVIGLLWFSLKVSVFEDYGNRFVMFGFIATSVLSAYAISKIKLLRALEYFLLGFIIFSFAISFFPIPYLKVEQQWQFDVANFYTEYSDDQTALVTDTFMGNYVYYADARADLNLYLTKLTVYGLDAADITLPDGIILRSSTQEMQTLKYSVDWGAFDYMLNTNYSLCYDNIFSKLYIKSE